MFLFMSLSSWLFYDPNLLRPKPNPEKLVLCSRVMSIIDTPLWEREREPLHFLYSLEFLVRVNYTTFIWAFRKLHSLKIVMKFLEILLKVKGNTKYYRELREWKHEEKRKREHGGYMIWLDDLSPRDKALVITFYYMINCYLQWILSRVYIKFTRQS